MISLLDRILVVDTRIIKPIRAVPVLAHCECHTREPKSVHLYHTLAGSHSRLRRASIHIEIRIRREYMFNDLSRILMISLLGILVVDTRIIKPIRAVPVLAHCECHTREPKSVHLYHKLAGSHSRLRRASIHIEIRIRCECMFNDLSRILMISQFSLLGILVVDTRIIIMIKPIRAVPVAHCQCRMRASGWSGVPVHLY
jgi:ribosomal protein L20A (L18A)